VLDGRGATTVWQNNGARQSFECNRKSVCHPAKRFVQHFNGQGDKEARLLAVTTAPLVFNLFHCEDFVINNPYAFHPTASKARRLFRGSGKLYSDRVVETNFVADAINIEPVAWDGERKGQCDHLL